MSFFSIINFITDNWTIVLAMLVVAAASLVVSHFFGRKMSLGALVPGVLWIFYIIGGKNARDNYKKKRKDIEEKRNEAYDKIDSRNTDRDDVLDRLRKRRF